MRWSSRVGDLAKLLFVVGPHAPDCSLQRLTANLSGSNPYTTRVDVSDQRGVLRHPVGRANQWHRLWTPLAMPRLRRKSLSLWLGGEGCQGA